MNASLPKMGFLLFILAVTVTVLPKLRTALEGRLISVPSDDGQQGQSDDEGINSISLSQDSQTSEQDPASQSEIPKVTIEPNASLQEDLALDEQTRDLISIVADNSLRMSKREMPAYWELVRKTSRTSFQKLRESANAKIKFNELYGNPAKHRGELIAVDMVVRRVTRYDAEPGNKANVDGVYEIWGSTDQSHAWLYVFITDSLPDGFNEETILKKRTQFAGYFLKLLAYQPGSASPNAKPLLAPMLIGRLKADPKATAVATNDTPWWATWGLSSFIVVAAAFLTLRVFLSASRPKKRVEEPRDLRSDFDSLWDETKETNPTPLPKTAELN